MDYLELGYDQFLTKTPFPSTNQEYDPLQFDLYAPESSGSKIQGGILQTTDGKTNLNLEGGYFSVNDGSMEIIRLGVQEDGTIGLVIRDREGNELLNFTGNKNLLQSSNQHFLADFNNEYIIAKDEGGTPRALFGKGDF